MCGILGLVTTRHRRLSLDEPAIIDLRDRLARRGPDDAGLWTNGHVALAHRRLAILDPENGAQPLAVGTPGQPDHAVIAYNGELYNHPDLWAELVARGRRFGTGCDTETVLRSFIEWRLESFRRFRGMYALAVYEPERERLTLARDPLGIKPLYYALIESGGGRELVFASEPVAILAHPRMPRQPDWTTLGAYLTTIRTTFDDRSLFAGLRVVRPGEIIEIDLGGEEMALRHRLPEPADIDDCDLDFEDAARALRQLVEEAVEDHLISDVPTCALLSGGLDSAIIASVAARHVPGLRTYCAGAPVLGEDNADFPHARRMAAHLGSRHVEVPVRRTEFLERWPWMIGELGVPLSTPNEIAIHLVARRLAEDAKVALTGEGADEFFAGYGPLIRQALTHFAAGADDADDAAAFCLESMAWIPPSAHETVFTPDLRAHLDGGAALREPLRAIFADAHAGESGLRAFLTAQQRLNLTGLLGRLDTATMLASVEGRTPFADRIVGAFARSLPFSYLYGRAEAPDDETGADSGGGGVAVASETGVAVTKRILRRAFADCLPPEILHRPKASFPLPFEFWMADATGVLRESSMLREVFTARAMEAVTENAAGHWSLAWPMINLAHWFRVHWG